MVGNDWYMWRLVLRLRQADIYTVLGAVRQITNKLDLKNECKKLKNREGNFYEVYGK